MNFDIVTIFPDFFTSILSHGVLRRAIEEELLSIHCHDLRQFTHDRHRTVDDRPFGGGEGMVLKPEPIAEAIDFLGLAPRDQRKSSGEAVILLSPQGARFDQRAARRLSQMSRIVLLCGRYEGVDERISKWIADEEISIGDYVLSGGELAAAVIVDSVMRLLPGVLGNEASGKFESFGLADAALAPAGDTGQHQAPRSTWGAGGLLDYPQYTRPTTYRGWQVPEVLSGGDHEQIRRWRRKQALIKTLRNRPDLLDQAELSEEERAFLAEQQRCDRTDTGKTV